MTPAALMAIMATLQCHTITVDVPTERQTIAYTVCVKVEVVPEPVEVVKPVVKKPVVKRKAGVGCKRRWYWKNHRKRWRCVR